jgi:rubrerythrin
MTKSLQDLLLMGIRAEIEAIDAYTKLGKSIDNPLLKDRFEALARDEHRHQEILEKIYEENFPGKQMTLPERSGVPKPNAKITNENTLAEVLSTAMDAEKKAENYYNDLADMFADGQKKELLMYLANIESGHYYFLKLEYDMAMKNKK